MRNRHARGSGARPLIEHCDGAEADDMSALMAAWLRIWRQQSKAGGTDLHCEHFIRWIFAMDKSGSGVQKTYGEIADHLRLPIPTARKVVERSAKEFGLIIVIEERYARGGQGANRYKIDWQTARAVNAGLATRNEIMRNRDGRRPADTTDHPYKECHSIPDRIPSPSIPQDAAGSSE